jgi:putative transposase
MMSTRWYNTYSVSYRDIEEILEERGVSVDHATVNRWVIKFSTILLMIFKKRKKRVLNSWRMDETYIEIKKKWHYYYRAVDKEGNTIDFFLSKKRDKKAAMHFFKQSIENEGLPDKVNIYKSGSNYFALKAINEELDPDAQIEITQIKMKNQIIEQDHRFIKRITNPMLGFKSFEGANATLKGIELCHMLRKKQSRLDSNLPSWKQFYALVG